MLENQAVEAVWLLWLLWLLPASAFFLDKVKCSRHYDVHIHTVYETHFDTKCTVHYHKHCRVEYEDAFDIKYEKVRLKRMDTASLDIWMLMDG